MKPKDILTSWSDDFNPGCTYTYTALNIFQLYVISRALGENIGKITIGICFWITIAQKLPRFREGKTLC
jgi:hypothetical protein